LENSGTSMIQNILLKTLQQNYKNTIRIIRPYRSSSTLANEKTVETVKKDRTPRERAADFFGLLGAIANWGVPLAAMANLERDPERLNPRMTSALFIYSIFFTRWAVTVHPRNYPLFLCHFTNICVQFMLLVKWSKWKLIDSPK